MPQSDVIYSAHHAGTDYGDFLNRTTLTEEERLRFSDYFSDRTIPEGGTSFQSTYSRAIVDLNRPLRGDPTLQFNPSDELFPMKDFGRPARKEIWKPGEAPTTDERIAIVQNIYRPYMRNLLGAVRQKRDRPLVVVAWDSSSDGVIGREADGTERRMPSIILSNDGNRNMADVSEAERARNIITTCDPVLLEELAKALRITLADAGLPNDVRLNYYDDTPNDEVGNIVRTFNSRTNPNLGTEHAVEALQVEYNAQLVTDYDTLKFHPQKAAALKIAFERAMTRAYTQYVTNIFP